MVKVPLNQCTSTFVIFLTYKVTPSYFLVEFRECGLFLLFCAPPHLDQGSLFFRILLCVYLVINFNHRALLAAKNFSKAIYFSSRARIAESN